jgi:hypothetical protein
MPADKYYVPGSFWRISDRTGFKVRSYNTRKEWNNLIVERRVWEARQPQDFVKGVKDDQTVPEARPRQPDTFIELNTTGPRFYCYNNNHMNGAQFLVLQGPDGAVDFGINSESNYTNPNGTAGWLVYGLTPVPPVDPSQFPSNMS